MMNLYPGKIRPRKSKSGMAAVLLLSMIGVSILLSFLSFLFALVVLCK